MKQLNVIRTTALFKLLTEKKRKAHPLLPGWATMRPNRKTARGRLLRDRAILYNRKTMTMMQPSGGGCRTAPTIPIGQTRSGAGLDTVEGILLDLKEVSFCGDPNRNLSGATFLSLFSSTSLPQSCSLRGSSSLLRLPIVLKGDAHRAKKPVIAEPSERRPVVGLFVPMHSDNNWNINTLIMIIPSSRFIIEIARTIYQKYSSHGTL
jgi:hypothetical protein